MGPSQISFVHTIARTADFCQIRARCEAKTFKQSPFDHSMNGRAALRIDQPRKACRHHRPAGGENAERTEPQRRRGRVRDFILDTHFSLTAPFFGRQGRYLPLDRAKRSPQRSVPLRLCPLCVDARGSALRGEGRTSGGPRSRAAAVPSCQSPPSPRPCSKL